MKWACHLAIFLVSGVGWDKFLTILEETEWTSSGCIGPSGWPADTGTLVVAAGAGSGGRFGAEPKAAEIQFYQDKTSLRRPPFVPTAPSVNLRTSYSFVRATWQQHNAHTRLHPRPFELEYKKQSHLEWLWYSDSIKDSWPGQHHSASHRDCDSAYIVASVSKRQKQIISKLRIGGKRPNLLFYFDFLPVVLCGQERGLHIPTLCLTTIHYHLI